jgi:hypothetical protein
MTASVKNLTGKVNAGTPKMRQIGDRLVALGRLDRRVLLAVRPTAVGSCPLPRGTRVGLQSDLTVSDGHLHRKDD